MVIKGVGQNLRSNFIRLFKPRTPPSDAITSNIFLPTELWLNIISYLSEESIQSLSLTCNTLSLIAQPFLFHKNLVLYPFLTTITHRRLDRAEYVARSLDRLNFFASPRIEPYIQELSLVPYPRGHALSRYVDPDIPENEVVNRLFEILPLLSHLRKLVIWSVKLTPERITTLKQLSIRHLELETRGDDMTWHSAPETAFSIPIPSNKIFSLNCTVNPRHIHWFFIPLHFLYPESLEEIYSGPDGTESILTAMSSSPYSLTSLQVLEISLRFISSPHFLPALKNCPNLTSFSLLSSLTDNLPQHQPPAAAVPMAPNIIPLLTSYQGPPSLVESLSQGRTLRHVKLWSSRQPLWVWEPQKLLPFLPKLGSNVVTLEIGVTTLPSTFLEALCDFLPNLRRLYVNAHLSTAHTGIRVTTVTHVSPGTHFKPGLLGDTPLRLDILAFGAQLSNDIPPGSLEEETAVLDALAEFPSGYDPTSWQRWSIESPWSKIIWERSGDDGVGSVSVERTDYKKPTFPRRG